MAWFRKQKQRLEKPLEKRVQTEGLWVKCEGCKNILWKKDLQANLFCCPRCGHHFKMGARSRMQMLFDDGRYTEHDANLASTDPLNFQDTKSYRERLVKAQKATGLRDALLTGEGKLAGTPAIICAMEFDFIGGSMGAVVGEKITRAIDRCIAQRLPLIVVSCSGGARMMEGAISLMQMA
jgi:acetyl-CoA carboxylase carboxyl transferase subunit beta